MRILILGASGLVGKALYGGLSPGYDAYGTYCKNRPGGTDPERWLAFDFAGAGAFREIAEASRPDIVISSLVGSFEQQMAVHAQIADYLGETGGRCVFISTANVFDGAPGSARTETDDPFPVSGYGKFKHACEQMLKDRLGGHCLTVRLPHITSKEAAEKLIKRVEDGEPVYTNLHQSCNSSGRVAASVRRLIETEGTGIIHLTSSDTVTQEDFLELLLKRFGRSVNYKKAALTLPDYCKALGCEDPSLVRAGSPDKFYVALASIRQAEFGIEEMSCADIVNSL